MSKLGTLSARFTKLYMIPDRELHKDQNENPEEGIKPKLFFRGINTQSIITLKLKQEHANESKNN